MSAFLRQMVEVHTETTAILMSVVRRRANPRYPRPHDRSDGDAVMSDFATTISDLGVATDRVIESHSDERVAP